MRILADTHAHTLVSGHAYSTIREMAAAAAQKNIRLLALTEHAPEMPGTCGLYYFQNLEVIPREMNGVQMLFGAELNILDEDGRIDLPEKVIKTLDITIASIHPPCFQSEAKEENVMRAYITIMRNPHIHIIGHPDDGRFPIDYELLVKTAKETGTLLELNNSSLRPASFRENARENMLTMLELCRQYDVPVTTGSDAHVDAETGNFCFVQEILEYCDFPEELVATTNIELLHTCLHRKQKEQEKK